ncbi:hypothetical protein [Herbiconiux solani]|uniref:hypothetical protein n=1 Tax=Herbiconiux solani TaxID=661329 RepID=UPI00082560D3|nr:hypothetical protein [Herbiconiux solani]
MSTRDRLDRRPPGRALRTIVLAAVGTVVIAALVAAGIALFVLPPVLAETPRERLTSAQPLTVTRTAEAVTAATSATSSPPSPSASKPDPNLVSASVTLDAGWVVIGVGPFLPADSAAATSPDGVYRADIELLPPAPTSSAPSASTDTAAPPSQAPASGPPDDQAPGEQSIEVTEPPIDQALQELLDERGVGAAVETAVWNDETLSSGVRVRYADLVDGDDTVTVAIATGPASLAGASAEASASAPITAAAESRLVLLARTPTAVAADYRTVTASLLASAVFASGSSTSVPSASEDES